MKSFGKLALLFFVLSRSILCQTVDFSGYYADFPVYQSLRSGFADEFGVEGNLFLNLARVRFRPVLDLGWGSKFYIEYEITALYHSTDLLFNPAEISLRRQLLKLKWDIESSKKFKISHFFDRFYFKKEFDFVHITIGRQRISWGTGRIWNPTDLFNPINPVNFSKIEKDGADVLALKFYLGSFTDVHLVYNPVDSFKKNNLGVRFRSNFGEFDFSFISGYFDKRIVFGFDFAGNLFNAGIRGEGLFAAEARETKSNFFKFILGLDNQFTKNLYVLVEYHFNGEGKRRSEEYEFKKLIRGEILNLSRNYIFASINYVFNPVLTLLISVGQNLNDGSGFLSSNISCLPSDNFELGIGLFVFFGSAGDEYWYYSNSGFLKLQFYF